MLKSKVIYLCAILLILGGALLLRIPKLDQKPMHGDEANQAVRAGMLMDSGVYHYDPTDHHGPVMYFAAMPFCHATAQNFSETTEWNYRLVTVCFSFITLLLMLGLSCDPANGGLFSNRFGLLFALFFTAISPAMTYYSRFFIQESMLLTFLTGMLVTGYAYLRTRFACQPQGVAGRFFNPSVMAALCGMFAGLSIATKETTVLSFAAMFIAAVAVFGVKRILKYWRTTHFLIAAVAALLVAALFFSSFFTHLRGLYDAVFTTVAAYTERATAVPEHHHPWYFYLRIIFWFKYGRGPLWSEAVVLIPALLAVICTARYIFKGTQMHAGHNMFVRFIFVYTLALTIIYSLIPYKTPWCALSFLHGWIILGGVGCGYVVDFLRRRFSLLIRMTAFAALAVSVAVSACWHLRQNYRACHKYAADSRNPFVYAHTGSDAINLVAAIEQAAQSAQGYETFIAMAVPTPDTWPLPWYLRKYKNVGYWNAVSEIPPNAKPTVIIAAADQGDIAAELFGKDMQCNFYGVRPGVLVNLFVPAQ